MDSLQLIKRPLLFIKNKLLNNAYKRPIECLEEIQNVLNNFYQSNPSQTLIEIVKKLEVKYLYFTIRIV